MCVNIVDKIGTNLQSLISTLLKSHAMTIQATQVSRIHFMERHDHGADLVPAHSPSDAPPLTRGAPIARELSQQRLEALLLSDETLRQRYNALVWFSSKVRVSEYHVTNACNIRCRGCWFFAYEHEKESREIKDLTALEDFVLRQRREHKINGALLIGGEPTLFPDRLAVFLRNLKYSTISTNGLKALPRDGFERLAIGISLFGGGELDDDLRAILPGGTRFSGLFDKALMNYRDDERAGFLFALTEDGIDHIEPTVQRIRANGNIVNFNFYSKYDTPTPSAMSQQRELLHEALRVAALYPNTVISHPYYIEAMITGSTPWGMFGYDSCPSISIDHPAHETRMANGWPVLPFFNTWAADMATVKFCCTSGHCTGCRDSQAVFSWLLVNRDRFLGNATELKTWIEIAESYWKQFIWSPYHRSQAHAQVAAIEP